MDKAIGNDTVRSIGFEGDISVVQALVPQSIADATPVLSSAIDLRAYPRCRFLAVLTNKEATATTHTIAMTITASATSGGAYTAVTTSGTLTALSADGAQYASFRFDPARPFIKVTLTGSNADVDVISSVVILAIKQSV